MASRPQRQRRTVARLEEEYLDPVEQFLLEQALQESLLDTEPKTSEPKTSESSVGTSV
eukprot:m.160801 g.160801  ORF g.160801 m.160801 type:complete len:58 (-) comp16510_c0_seq11:600-773(-)